MTLLSQAASIFDIIERMKNIEAIKVAIFDPVNGNPDPLYPEGPLWNDLSLADGYPSLLLLFSTLQRWGLIEENEEDVAHICIGKIKDALEKKGCDNFSLFSGVSGVCFALKQASHGGIRYQRMLTTLHTYLLKNVEELFLKPMRYNICNQEPSFAYLHDPIQGITGIGRYLLEGISHPDFFEAAKSITEVLIDFTYPLKVSGKDVPGWYSSPNDPLNRDNRILYPKGNFNLGLAHGVTGTLAFLAIALMLGLEVKGQREAIMRIAIWIREKSFLVGDLIQWPHVVSWEVETGEVSPTGLSCKDAWCYGAPGIARTLFLAGKALGDDGLKNFAVKAFQDIFCRRESEWRLPGPMFCHGIAGLLLITREMAKEEECKSLVPQVKKLEDMLLSFYNPDFLLGFKDIEPCKNGGVAQVTKAGLLGGSTGVLLTLLEEENHPSEWHLPFLINV